MQEWSQQHYLDGGWTLVLFPFYFEGTVLANVAVVKCYICAKPTNLSSSLHQEIDKAILGQIILCSVPGSLAMSLWVWISLLAPQLSYYY